MDEYDVLDDGKLNELKNELIQIQDEIEDAQNVLSATHDVWWESEKRYHKEYVDSNAEYYRFNQSSDRINVSEILNRGIDRMKNNGK